MMNTIDDILYSSRRPVVIAHRGASHYFHENTMEAFKAAVDMQAEMMEFDVHRTNDGVLIVHHDSDLTGSEIRDMSMSQIQEKTVETGYSVHALTEILEFSKGKIPVDVELKEAGYEEQVIGTVLDILEPDQFIVSSVFESSIRKVKDLQPDLKTGYILSSRPRWQLLNKLYPGTRARRAGADVLVVSQKLLKLGFLSTTQDLDLPIWVYTVNERFELWKALTEERVTAIFSDRPDVALLLRDLHAAGRRSIPEIDDSEEQSGNG